ncbi:MAG: NADH-quinone oxidoreductase subunit NuoB [Candidatus Omnitrophica bacterium]|nr:NADH-quinone oxidoreductase subunit NuoB [Candidatus Omnitrophota bacterium]MDD5671093.1 NADH-quinone oxidoreductase subunit NuoB [Candidatus Omnitrophota bacterium]
MFKVLWTRLQQKRRTVSFPKGKVSLPERFRGLPHIDTARCPDHCQECAKACPLDAVRVDGKKFQWDLGKCLFCADCMEACPAHAISYSRDYRLAVRKKENLILDGPTLELAQSLGKEMKRLFKRSLRLRQVSAGGCNACEADVNVLTTVVFDLARFGIDFVASPRHADGLLITGPVTDNMKLALEKTYQAVPHPKLVIAVGACAISGGPYRDHAETHNGADSVVPVDLYIPGCPPHPLTTLDGLLRLLGRL